MREEIPHRYKGQVVVVGGGPSGVAAAVSAARNGCKTLLLERYGFLGGMATAGLVNPFMTYYAGQEQIIGGIFQEVVKRLERAGGWGGEQRDRSFDPEIMKYICQQLCEESGVQLALHSFLCGAEVQEKLIKKAIVADKSGLSAAEGSIFIDCTGDADLSYFAGVPFEKGRPEDGFCQPMTLNFRMTNVNEARLPSWDEAAKIYQKAKKEGRITNPREDVMFFHTPRRGEVHFNTTRIIKLDATDPQQLTTAELEGRRQVQEMVDFIKRELPGFEKAELLYSATQIGVRESRRIVGRYTLTKEDVLGARKFSDGIARGSYPIDIHNPTGAGTTILRLPERESYDIPYRCLIPQKIDNLLVAGRCISTTHEAHSSTRIMPICFATGEAAGAAAALCWQKACCPAELDVAMLRAQLLSQGANWGVTYMEGVEAGR